MKYILVIFVVCCLTQELLGSHFLKKPPTSPAILNNEPLALLEKSKTGVCCVTFYKGTDYTGDAFELCENNPYVGDTFNDEITSLKFGENCDYVNLYRDKDYMGYSISVYDSVMNLKSICLEKYCLEDFCPCEKSWNDSVSSIKIFSG